MGRPQASSTLSGLLLPVEGSSRAIRFLLSDEASFITGANLPVDGGFSAAHLILP